MQDVDSAYGRARSFDAKRDEELLGYFGVSFISVMPALLLLL